MTNRNNDRPADAPLNPALKRQTDTSVDTDHVTPAPIDTASSKGGGEAWPVAWLVITFLCVLFAVYFLFV